MIVFTLKSNLKNYLACLKQQGHTIGFVPTMGALHDGHLSLIKQSLTDNNQTVVSVFVNPTQFDNKSDLEKYPRLLERDLYLLEKTDKDLIVYLPVAEDLYEGEIRSKKFDHGGLDRTMEGAFREGHFDGVATVVSLLFDAVNPDRAYFGEKDFQQLRIIQHMVQSNGLPVEIVPVPVFREQDGLAMSSRNLRLSPEMRQEAPLIYRALREAVRMGQEGKTVDEIKKEIISLFSESSLELEYFEIADEETLTPAQHWENGKHYRGFIAAYAGDIRLIDNIRIK